MVEDPTVIALAVVVVDKPVVGDTVTAAAFDVSQSILEIPTPPGFEIVAVTAEVPPICLAILVGLVVTVHPAGTAVGGTGVGTGTVIRPYVGVL
jgi:hypothetical protein